HGQAVRRALPCNAQATRTVTVARVERLDHHGGDGVNFTFEPPGPQAPSVTAERAAGLATQKLPFFFFKPVVAVLAEQHDLIPGRPVPQRLVWVLRNLDVPFSPTIGPTQCTEVSVIVDATTGEVLSGHAGSPVL